MPHGPTARQRGLGRELRRLREHQGLSAKDAADMLGWSPAKLNKVETAAQAVTETDVGRILETYGGPDPALRLAVAQLAREAGRRGWWVSYRDILDGSYAELEDAAAGISEWQMQLVPGLLQTRDYARALIRSTTQDEDVIDRRLQARMTRRTLLDRERPPALNVVLAEEVLRRHIASAGVMRQQFAALLAAGEREHIDIRVVPMRVPPFPGFGQGAMTMFEFASVVDLSVVYLETLAGGMYVEDPAQVAECSVKFGRIVGAALPVAESAALIADVVKELS